MICDENVTDIIRERNAADMIEDVNTKDVMIGDGIIKNMS